MVSTARPSVIVLFAVLIAANVTLAQKLNPKRPSKEYPAMRILALDIGKFKSVACDYEAESGRHSFATIPTTPKALHDLIVDREPDRVVIEICSIAGWVCDLVRALGIELQVANVGAGGK